MARRFPATRLPGFLIPCVAIRPTIIVVRLGSIGLGLYIAREVVCAHGGEIDVTSTEQETIFVITLPRSVDSTPGDSATALTRGDPPRSGITGFNLVCLTTNVLQIAISSLHFAPFHTWIR